MRSVIHQGPWQGEYTDGLTAAVHAVTVRIDPHGMSLKRRAEDGGLGQAETLASWTLSSLQADDSYKGLIRVTSRESPAAALTVAEPAFRDALVQAGLLKQAGSARRVLLGLLVAAAAVVGIIVVGIDPLSRSIAQKIPLEYEAKLNSGIMSRFTDDRCNSSESDAVLQKLLDQLRGPESAGIPFQVVLTKDDMVNAFALPGGTIVLTRGFLHAAESGDEVAGVMAHEMEHVIRRHVTTRIVRTAILTGVWHFTVGDFSGLLVVDPSTAYQLATLSFDRHDEADADRGALRMLSRAGISHDGFAAFFQRLKSEGPNAPTIISTHPDHDARLSLIAAQPKPARAKSALLDGEWQSLRAACGAPSK